jgi:hypothetical protein
MICENCSPFYLGFASLTVEDLFSFLMSLQTTCTVRRTTFFPSRYEFSELSINLFAPVIQQTLAYEGLLVIES